MKIEEFKVGDVVRKEPYWKELVIKDIKGDKFLAYCTGAADDEWFDFDNTYKLN